MRDPPSARTHPTHARTPASKQNIRKGEFARAKVSGKRAIDLGSGMGLGGLAFALLGADVVLSDVAAVLPLLRRNYEHNLSAAALRGACRRRVVCVCVCLCVCGVGRGRRGRRRPAARCLGALWQHSRLLHAHLRRHRQRLARRATCAAAGA
jgi:hypothetical protein